MPSRGSNFKAPKLVVVLRPKGREENFAFRLPRSASDEPTRRKRAKGQARPGQARLNRHCPTAQESRSKQARRASEQAPAEPGSRARQQSQAEPSKAQLLTIAAFCYHHHSFFSLSLSPPSLLASQIGGIQVRITTLRTQVFPLVSPHRLPSVRSFFSPRERNRLANSRA